MAGVFGCVSVNGVLKPECSAGGPMKTGNSSPVFQDAHGIFGAFERGEKNLSYLHSQEKNHFIAIHGLALYRSEGVWQKVDAERLSRLFESDGSDILKKLDGFFSLVVFFKEKRRLILMTDPSGSCPIHYCSDGETLWFGPDTKSILEMSGRKNQFSREGLAGFLINGYPLAQYTMSKDVFRLRPGQRLDWSYGDNDLSVTFYRDLKYDYSTRQSISSIADELYERLLDAQTASLVDDPENFVLALTGGYDSRTLLGAMCQVGKRPGRVFTWGIADDIPGSDPTIARRLAGIAGVEHLSVKYSHHDFVENASNWLRTSELLSDNFGHYAAGADRLGFDPDTIVFLGDHILGNSGYPGSCTEAVSMFTGVVNEHAHPRLSGWLTEDSAAELLVEYETQVNAIVSGCNSDHPKDIQHYLEFHMGTFGWLLAPGYYKEPLYAARRPMLLGTMLDYACQLAPENRIGKTHLLRMLKKSMPEFYRVPKSSSISLVDWAYQIRNDLGLKAYIQSNLDPGLVCQCDWLRSANHDQLRQKIATVFNQSPQPVKRIRRNLDPAMRFRDRLMRFELGRKWVATVSRKKLHGSGPADFRFMQRIAQLGMALKNQIFIPG